MQTIKAYLTLVVTGVFIFTLGLSPAMATTDEEMEYLQDDLEETMERLDAVEKKSLQDKMSIGAEIRIRSDWYTFKQKKGYNAQTDSYYAMDVDEYTPNLLNTRFRLNLKANVSKNLKFHSRLSMFTYWNDQDATKVAAPISRGQGVDEFLLVERAYADFFFTLPYPVIEKIPMAFTIGRLPLADGLPTNLRENTPRKSTYPAMAYDIIADGAGLSFDLTEYIPLPGAAFRFIYVNLVSDNDMTSYREGEFPGGNTLLFTQLEAGLKGRLEGTHIIFNLCYTPSIAPPESSVAAFFAAAMGEGTTMTPKADNPDTLGSITTATLYVQAERFLDSWFDWFVSAKAQSVNTADKTAIFLMNNAAQGIVDFPIPFGLLGESNIKNPLGYAFQLGTRINLPVDALKEPKVGIEFNWGSRHAIPAAYAAEDPLRKLDVCGAAFDFYYIQPVSRHFTIRAGHTRVYHEYDTAAIYYNTRRATDQDITNTYLLFDMKF